MDLAAVMDDLGSALETIDGLRVYPYWALRITPPAAAVQWPESYTYDHAYRRGMDRVTIPVSVIAGAFDARAARDRLAAYADGDGDQSIKRVVEAHTPAAYDTARVSEVQFEAVTIAGVDYMAATFTVEITGPGG